MEENIKILEDYLSGKKMQYGIGYIGFKEFVALENLIKDYKDLHLAYELYKSKNENLEAENRKLRTDNINNLCEECFELAKEAGITEEDTRKILKDYRDKVENSIPVSELKNDLKYMKNAKATGVKQLLMKKGIIGYLEKLLEERE